MANSNNEQLDSIFGDSDDDESPSGSVFDSDADSPTNQLGEGDDNRGAGSKRRRSCTGSCRGAEDGDAIIGGATAVGGAAAKRRKETPAAGAGAGAGTGWAAAAAEMAERLERLEREKQRTAAGQLRAAGSPGAPSVATAARTSTSAFAPLFAAAGSL